MNGRYLLDTNIVIAALSDDSDVVGNIEDADEYFVCATILGEVLYGAYLSTNADENLRRIDSFHSKAGFLACDQTTAEMYGEIKTELRRKGRPIPDNDIWVTASAEQHSLTLVTRDVHFVDVDNLPLIRS